jgi:hypothetical protein
MEEYSAIPPAEDEKGKELGKKRKKQRTPGFLETYLKLLRQDTENTPQAEEKPSDASIWRKIAKLFRKSDSFIPQPELITEKSTEPELQEDLGKTQAAETHESNLEFEYAPSIAQEQNEPQIKPELPEVDDGELVIDHSEAEEMHHLAAIQTPEYQPEFITQPEPIPEAELVVQPHVSAEAAESVGSIVNRMSTRPETAASAARAQEYLRAQRERRIKRDVRRLKYRSRHQVNRQKALEQRQKELEKQLKEGMERESRTNIVPEIVRIPQTISVERTPEKKMQSQLPAALELQPQEFRELVNPKPDATKPEEVLKRVEIAAKENVPIEQIYERRHEIKDESNKQAAAARAVIRGTAERLQDSSRRLARSIESTKDAIKDLANAAKPDQLTRDNPELYSQSMKAGFWAAVAILVLFLVASLVK